MSTNYLNLSIMNQENDIGFVIMPEQYDWTPIEGMVDNSQKAKKCFKKMMPKVKGEAFLVKVLTNSLQMPMILSWMYVDTKNATIHKIAPVFRIEDEKTLDSFDITQIEPITNECFFFYEDELFAVTFTSKGYILVKKVRSILNEKDIYNVIALEGVFKLNDAYPVEIYCPREERFLCVCWSLEVEDEEGTLWKPVCADDQDLLDKYSDIIQELEEYPIELNETANIGGESYTLCYDKGLEKHFVKTVTLEAIKKETKFQIVVGEGKAQSSNENKPKNEGHSAKIIQMTFKR